MATNPSPIEPMSEAERHDMLRLIEQRKNDLIEKKKLLDTLTKEGTKKFGTSVVSSAGPSLLLKDVMAAMSEAQAQAEKRVTTLPTDLELGKDIGKSARSPVLEQGARYSHALKRVIGPLSSCSGAVDVIITPKVIDRFEKSCQCDPIQLIETGQPTAKGSKISTPTVIQEARGGGAKVTVGYEHIFPLDAHNKAEEIKKHQRVSIVTDISVSPSAHQKQATLERIGVPKEPLSEDEKKKLIYSAGFDAFFQKASRTIERALGESELFDVFADYSQLKSGGDQGTSEGERLRPLDTYLDNRWSLNRAILDVCTHPKFNELFLVSYAQKSDASIHDPDGCALIWNISMPQRAEYVFSCQSQVCTAIFDTYRPNNVIGGTFTGSIVLWDTRAKTRPVQRTPLSTKGHHHAVYSMQLVGTEHAHNLVTVDLDGRLCLWSLSMLVQPTETIELKRSGKDICCMCIDFPEGESNSFIGGGEDGSLFQAQIHGSKAGIIESYSGHTAPVTSIHWHPTESRTLMDDMLDCSDLVLSSSFDWTIKLWNPKSQQQSLHTFQASDDYCMDVEWHPHHPAIFASCQADGELNIWDISKDIEVPHVVQTVNNSALTRLKWSNDGCRLMTGDTKGVATMWGVSNEISQSRQEDRLRLAATIEELKATEQHHEL